VEETTDNLKIAVEQKGCIMRIREGEKRGKIPGWVRRGFDQLTGTVRAGEREKLRRLAEMFLRVFHGNIRMDAYCAGKVREEIGFGNMLNVNPTGELQLAIRAAGLEH